MTEEEEDVNYLKDAGLIDISEAQALLRELEFENAEINFAAEDDVFDELHLN